MIFGVIVEFAVGAVCILLGALIWGKQKISLLHDYHYNKVKKEDIPAYARGIGIGLILIGAGIAGAGGLNLVSSPLWWLPLVGGIVIGIILIVAVLIKYNGSIIG